MTTSYIVTYDIDSTTHSVYFEKIQPQQVIKVKFKLLRWEMSRNYERKYYYFLVILDLSRHFKRVGKYYSFFKKK